MKGRSGIEEHQPTLDGPPLLLWFRASQRLAWRPISALSAVVLAAGVCTREHARKDHFHSGAGRSRVDDFAARVMLLTVCSHTDLCARDERAVRTAVSVGEHGVVPCTAPVHAVVEDGWAWG